MTRGTLIVLGLGVLLLGACSKRPVTAAVAAPAPVVSRPSVPAQPAPPPAARAPVPAAATRPSGAARDASGRIPPGQFERVSDLVDIHFDFDQYAINPQAAKRLDANAVWLTKHPAHILLIEGHCDERGTGDYNIALAERRAFATRSYLVARGVRSSRITIVSYGEERPLCTERSEACWAKNRRAHFLVKRE
ncbi:MAG: peptidoglycan-associated lipoprotein Pal [Candidatus Rokubacteria bacterium]|nr:peptidoglycan-associated lipoprotein Pal [Candidatus Rokubacteria bacterium]